MHAIALACGMWAALLGGAGIGQEGETPAAAVDAPASGIVVESWTLNGWTVHFTVRTPDSTPGPEGEPTDSLAIRFEQKAKSGAWEEAKDFASVWSEDRFDETHEIAFRLQGAFDGRVRMTHLDAGGNPIGEPLDVPFQMRDAAVQLHEETVGRSEADVELIPGFPEPLVLVAEDEWGDAMTDLAASYQLSVEGPGAGDYRFGVATYRQDMTLDVAWWGGLETSAHEAEGPADLEFRGGAARIFVEAKPNARPATLVGMPGSSRSKVSPIRIRLESGFSREKQGEGLVLQRMRTYNGHWRLWISAAQAMDSPWRMPGGSLSVVALEKGEDDWIETAPPFTAVDWVCACGEGRHWTFTGHRRDRESDAPMKLVFYARDGEDAVLGSFEVDVK